MDEKEEDPGLLMPFDMSVLEDGLDSPTPSLDDDRLQQMEEQYEMMNSSLIALTTHFAQVQFRLRQIVEAPPEEKESLLKSLEEFAFRGIPEMENNACRLRICPVEQELEDTLTEQRIKQADLIAKLKMQLADLESYAWESGEGSLPQNIVLEKQKVILDQLKSKLNFNLDEIDKMSVDELKAYVDHTVSQIISPLKMKEQLVSQLKTQIADLEMFVQFLQGDATAPKCQCSSSGVSRTHQDQMRGKMLNTIKRIAALLQIFASTQFHVQRKFRRNSPKRSMKTKHWGDLRAHLEIAIENVIELAREPENTYADSDYVSDSENTVQCNSKLATAVRKQLAVGIQNLMQHGLMNVNNSLSLVPFSMCFRPKETPSSYEMHAWELILRYYDLKNGDQFNSTPARKLSQSFNLDIVGGSAISAKQSLLSVIGNIMASHDPYKRSYDSQFKAMVCAGLNCKMLVPWLRVVLRCQHLLEMHYTDWSYVLKTGFEDTYTSLEKLNQFHFNLPVDLAVRQLNDIKDAF